MQMSNDELSELFHSEKFQQISSSNNREKRMEIILDERKSLLTRIDNLELRLESLEKQTENDRKTSIIQNEEQTHKYNEMIAFQKLQQENLQQYDVRIKEQANQIQKYEKLIETFQKKIEMQEIQIKQQKETINQIEQKKKQKENEEEELKTQLETKVTLNLQSDQTLKGKISIVEHGKQFDQNRSKYILNTNSSPTLGQDSYENGTLIKYLNENITFNPKPGTYFLHAIVFDSIGRKSEIVSSGVRTNGAKLTFGFTGRVQTATLEAGEYKLEVWGAEGGKTSKYSKSSGKGGYSVGTIKLSQQTTLYIYVGESPSTNSGGWNGGGSGGNEYSTSGLPAGGGGSTDISLYGESGSFTWNTNDHLYSRIIVAGGGGGSGYNDDSHYGGYGGGLEGQSSGYGPAENGGTQNRAGTNQSYSTGQGFGVGGTHTGCSSGGGGGWFGGGASKNSCNCTGGSGGSGYVYCSSTASNYPNGCMLDSSLYLIDAKTQSGNESFPTPDVSSTETGHTGHGYVKITA